METEAPNDDIFQMRRSTMGGVLAGLIALKVGLLFLIAWNRRFVMDEFVQLGWAKYLSNGLYRTVWPAKAAGFAVFSDVAHLIGWNARSILLIGRMETALLACATLAIIYACARSFGESKTRSALILLILLSFSNFIERIIETRAEPLAVFFAAAALLVMIRGGGRNWHIFTAGALSGLAFLSTQKSLYFNVALGVALVGDAALARRYPNAIARGVWLVLGWAVPVIGYCLLFGVGHPLAVAKNLVFGPLAVASSQTAAEYGGLRHYVGQTLARNALLYVFCFGGMLLALRRISELDGRKRIGLIFAVVVTAFVFAHNQPWPYVFVMALPFMALWALEPFDALTERREYRPAAWAVLGVAVVANFVANVEYLRLDNHDQLSLISRAEPLLSPSDIYFDGVGMLPNRQEPSTLWLDKHAILTTLREGRNSEAYRIFASSPPKIILWSYRMDAIEPVLGQLIRNSYVQIAPNLKIAGRRLHPGEPTRFNVPVAGRYALYDLDGNPMAAELDIDGKPVPLPQDLAKGSRTVALPRASRDALLLPEGRYGGQVTIHGDNLSLFAGVYD